MNRLGTIRVALLRELGGNDTRLRFINTRLILNIGIDLNDIQQSDDFDPEKVELTLQTLKKMGFFNSLEEEAERAE